MQYRFRQFVLDTAQLHLTAGGAPVNMDARPLQLLRLLIETYPEPCSKNQLLEHLWPDSVVSQWSAGRVVSDTRRCFRELGYDGPLIQTLHGRGYRLAPELAEELVPVRENDAGEAGEVPEERAQEVVPLDPPAADLYRDREIAPPAVPSAPDDRPFASRHVRWLGPLALFLCVAAGAWLVALSEQSRDRLRIGEADGVRGRILWVDDHPDNNRAERAHFEANHIAVYSVKSTEDALTLLNMYRYDAVISDMGRSGDSLAGFHLLERLRARGDQTPFFLYTILSSDAQRRALQRRGGQGVATSSKGLYRLALPLFGPAARD